MSSIKNSSNDQTQPGEIKRLQTDTTQTNKQTKNSDLRIKKNIVINRKKKTSSEENPQITCHHKKNQSAER